MKSQKKEINLKKTKETIHIVYTYRTLKFLEKVSHRDKSFKDLTQKLLDKYDNDSILLEQAFVTLALEVKDLPIYNTEGFLHSNELNELSTLYRILKGKNRLEEALAVISFIRMHPEENINEEKIEELAAFLKHYINNPEVQKEYKEYNIKF